MKERSRHRFLRFWAAFLILFPLIIGAGTGLALALIVNVRGWLGGQVPSAERMALLLASAGAAWFIGLLAHMVFNSAKDGSIPDPFQGCPRGAARLAGICFGYGTVNLAVGLFFSGDTAPQQSGFTGGIPPYATGLFIVFYSAIFAMLYSVFQMSRKQPTPFPVKLQ